MRSALCLLLLTLLTAWIARGADAVEIDPLLETIRAVGPEGAGQTEAAQAWRQLVGADASQLPKILAGMDGAGPLSSNWIALAVGAVAERQLQRGGQLPSAELEKFVLDRSHAPHARRLAYEWLLRVDSAAESRLVPGMLDDPSLELRRDAVARLIEEAGRIGGEGGDAKAIALFEKALTGARDVDQIKLLVTRLRKAGRTVDLPRHMGFILRWKVIGPFDNSEEKGYDVAYPPEKELDLGATLPGKHGPVKWMEYTSTDDYGKVDLNNALGEEKEVVGYAMTEFVSDKEVEVEFRLTSFNAVKLWLNGKLIDKHNVYHGGSELDQYTSRGVLHSGRNTILVKVCQNAQTQTWARHWAVQLRVCNQQGTAILSADRPASEPAK